MKFGIELFYNALEALIITGFISFYFTFKPKPGAKIAVLCTLLTLFIFSTAMTIIDLPWFLALVLLTVLLIGILKVFFVNNSFEFVIISIVAAILLALSDVCVVSSMSVIFNVEYQKLVIYNDSLRFCTVLAAKSLYVIVAVVIVSFKRNHPILLNKLELLVVSLTMIISVILICIVRNMIYDTNKNYNYFLVAVMSLWGVNIGQYLSMVYISKKNINEQKVSIMKKQIELQERNISELKDRFDDTAKIRHDMRNYISCALRMAENREIDALVKYLREISKEKLDTITTYIKIDRKALSAIINSKFAIAERIGIKVHYTILNELDNISEIDACILIANLLDNAIEACEKNENDSEIYLKIWSEAAYYLIEIGNTVEIDVLADNPLLLTSKKDKNLHGIGLKSVKNIVEKYDGIINFKHISNEFVVYISLCKEKN